MNKKVKIAHSLDQLEDDVILTLVDRPILDQGNLNDEDDVLQNDEIQMVNEAKHNVQLKSKLKNIADAASSHLEAKNEGQSGLLPHYDDYSYKPNTIQVDNGIIIKSKKQKRRKALGSDYIENDIATTKLNSEYSTKMAKSKGNYKSNSKDLLNFLDDTAEDNINIFKRQQQDADILKDSMDQLKKKRILENSIKNVVKNQEVDDQEESLLLRYIERSRKKAQLQKKRFNVLQAIKEEQSQNQQTQKKTVQIELNPISYQSTETVRQDNTIGLRQAIGGTSSVMFAHLPSQRLINKNSEVAQTPMKFQDFSKEQLQKMRKQVQFLEDKQVGLGLAGTLAFLRQNALLGKEEQVGRHNDKTVSYNDPNDRIKIQYRNASGKLMKPKEAYRYICAKFHGQGPSKNKVQIRKKREFEELRMKSQSNDGGQLLKLLEKHQSQSNEAHMVFNLGSKRKE